MRMYILINQDIKLGKGKACGQVGHSVESFIVDLYKNNNQEDIKRFEDYHKCSNQKKIVLSCPQKKLEELESKGYITIRDSGLTELEPNTLTCVNVGVFDKEELESDLKFIKFLSLYH